MARPPPNHYSSQLYQRKSTRTHIVKVWDASLMMHERIWWHTNAGKFTNIHMKEQALWQRFIAQRKSPGGVLNLAERELITKCVWGCAQAFLGKN